MRIILFVLLFYINGWSFENCPQNVKDQFEKLSPHGKHIPIKIEKGVFLKWSYTNRALNGLGLDNHFQSIQKLPGENNFVLSGSDINEKRGDLIIINNGQIIKREPLGKYPYWHPGGIQLLGDILALPIEEYKKTEVGQIYFFDFKDVVNPKKLPVMIDIPKTKAGAVFFYRFPDGKYLIGSYNMSKIDFYFSNTSYLLDGFEKIPRLTYDRRKFGMGQSKPFEFGAQNINLIRQCDGKLFLILFENTGKAAPVFNGDDRALLFTLDLNNKENPINLVTTKIFNCNKRCNFAAAAGTYIDSFGRLYIYSSPHYLSPHQNSYSVQEFGEK